METLVDSMGLGGLIICIEIEHSSLRIKANSVMDTINIFMFMLSVNMKRKSTLD